MAAINSTTAERLGSAPPVLSDVTEQAVLDLVPFRRAGRIVADLQGQPGFIGQFLQCDLPQPDPTAIGTAAIRGNHQPGGRRISLATHRLVPAADGVDRELGGIVIDADTDAARIRRDVVDTIGNGFAEFLVDEVMHIDLVRAAFRSVVAARVLVRADQFLLLGIDRDHRLTGGLQGNHLLIDMLELGVTVGMMAALLGLTIDLATIREAFEQRRDAARRNLMPHAAQRRREFRMALGDPHQRSR